MSLIMRSYRLRVYPNGAQRRLLDRWFGATRWLWNTALEIRSEAYRTCGLSLTGNDLSRWLTQWKHTAGHEWLAEVPATALTQCLRDQDRAFSRFLCETCTLSPLQGQGRPAEPSVSGHRHRMALGSAAAAETRGAKTR